MTVPSFFIYGEPDKQLDIGFMHVETVMERRHMHYGRVDAHKHDKMAQITLWTCGQGSYFIEDQKLDFIAPAASFMPSGVVHGFTVDADCSDAIVASIADSALPPIAALSMLNFDQPVMVRGQRDHRNWQNLLTIMTRVHEDYRQGAATSLAALIAVATNDMATLASLDHASTQGGNDLAQAFRRLVDSHFRKNWPVEHYISALGTTPHLLGKACRQAYGVSVKIFIDQRRLLEAKRLLLFTVRSVEDIAYEIGFHDPAYFSRFFNTRTGLPPGEWRNGQKNRPA
ncbi:helix-turn-helix domain-containing protein [Rhizobium oryziradicis]|uniref:AraC family transcriptional regulator n=1 Tax=Rhizobium oryziradicis TaxID=1867956 RepID=A0A1Q8ZV74_9HYPH|nr:helix-turn-helix domain-containing protein [Rhizobium oryziradicis]OLP45970.1 AraC family transcriptional regulator [Rhizobium oryziradicis]